MQDKLTIFPQIPETREKPLAFDLSINEWKEWCCKKNIPSYRAKQIYEWPYKKGISDPQLFSNLPISLRNLLLEEFDWTLPAIDCRLKSADGSEKILLKTKDSLLIEMVLMLYDDRVTLCMSSQVGCRIGCTFCQTGKMGFKRNLSSGEILSQTLLANQILKNDYGKDPLTNIVFMGMGEPLDNLDQVMKACRILIDPQAFGLSKSRVTISTSGLVPELMKLGQELPMRLAISLHSADEEKRSNMMPINRKYSLAELKKALLSYPASPRDGITFEYVMIEGVNDQIQDAKKLVTFVHGLKAKVNLIPLNHFPGMPMKASQTESIKKFQTYLADRSIPAPVRYSRGQDVSGGCGQLAAKRETELQMDPRQLHRNRRQSGVQLNTSVAAEVVEDFS